MINLSGEVIGINTAIISRTGGSQGIGFAIPSNTVRVALESLLKKGRIIRGYLGIQAQVNPQNLTADEDGVLVGDVLPGSPAADARLQKGDVIRKFNGRDVKNFPELRSLVAQAELQQEDRGGGNARRQTAKGVCGTSGAAPGFSNRAGHPTAWATKSQQSFAAAKCAGYNTGSR